MGINVLALNLLLLGILLLICNASSLAGSGDRAFVSLGTKIDTDDIVSAAEMVASDNESGSSDIGGSEILIQSRCYAQLDVLVDSWYARFCQKCEGLDRVQATKLMSQMLKQCESEMKEIVKPHMNKGISYEVCYAGLDLAQCGNVH
jgi:hypothetical protein